MEQLAPHEKVFVDKEWFSADPIHGSISCTTCHGGNPEDDNWRTAHDNVMKDPSWESPETSCGLCHGDIVGVFATSLHATLKPYVKAVDMRLSRDPSIREPANEARETHCMSCHSSCGQCHISRPDPVEGGLLASHFIQKRPPQKETCAACHGSRVDREFFGKNEGVPADVHTKKYLRCGSCHTGDEMHGNGVEYDSRYEVANRARCVDCHEGIYTQSTEYTPQHVIHRDKASCQVCHAMPYKNCYTCHVGKDIRGLSYFKTEPSDIDFKIGLNPLQSDDRPEQFVTVRHIPIDHELFGFYVEDAFTNFDNVPTWKLATPHTIQRRTPQNESCGNCHGNRDLFLQESDVRDEYLEANRGVIVPDEMMPVDMGR